MEQSKLPFIPFRKIASVLAALAVCVSSVVWGQTADVDPVWVERYARMVDDEIQKVRRVFAVYEDLDSGYNHGTFSGVFGSPSARDKILIDPGCIPLGNPPTGCSLDANATNRERGTVLRVEFQPLVADEFVGVSAVEPAGLFLNESGAPYDLRGIERLTFDAMSPTANNGLRVQFGFGGSTAPFRSLTTQWSRITINLSDQTAIVNPERTSILFTIVTNAANARQGGIVLLDNIRFEPVPATQMVTLGFPPGFKTYGVVPVRSDLPGPIPVPPDQLFRNHASIEAMAWAAAVLLELGEAYQPSAKLLLDSFVYAAANRNQAVSPPAISDGTAGLLSCLSSGDIALKNNLGGARAGNIRPCGVTVGTGYRVVLDDATGGQNAAVILALLRGYATLKEDRYLQTAFSLATWIQEYLADRSTEGYGGFFYGYQFNSQMERRELLRSKTTIDNALIFSALAAIADAATSARRDDAEVWRGRAANAAQFVKAMYRPDGRFYSGTVPEGQPHDPDKGIRPDGAQRGADVINSYDLIAHYTIVPLALAAAPNFRSEFDIPGMTKALLTKATTLSIGSSQLSGFFSVEDNFTGAGIDWISTGAAALALQLAAAESGTEISSAAQKFLEQYGAIAQTVNTESLIPAASILNESARPPSSHCLVGPFGCQPTRPSIGATMLAIAAAKKINLFAIPGLFAAQSADRDPMNLNPAFQAHRSLDQILPTKDKTIVGPVGVLRLSQADDENLVNLPAHR